jgi:hypothetical protein
MPQGLVPSLYPAGARAKTIYFNDFRRDQIRTYDATANGNVESKSRIAGSKTTENINRYLDTFGSAPSEGASNAR